MGPLQVLRLKDCKMHQDASVDVVKSLSACKHITTLDLSGNTLGDGGCHLADTITTWGPNAPLKELYLRGCKMPQDASVDVVKSLTEQEHLTILDLSCNTLGDGGGHLADTITTWGPNAPLKELYLRGCKMPQDASVGVVKSLSACKYLTHLVLSGNTLGDGGSHLAESIMVWGKDTPLQELWLQDCKMPQDASVNVVKSLSACKHLTHLVLEGNTLGDGGCHLAVSITTWGPNAPLQELGLTHCKMWHDASVDVVKSLSTCKHLTHLVIEGNTLGDGGCHLADSITTWGLDAPLQVLYLRGCKMPQDASVDIVKSLTVCKHLKELDLSGNTLGDGGHHLEETIRYWGPNPPLQFLGLDNCQIPKGVNASLLLVVSTWKCLYLLSLPGNTLTGCLPNYIPQPSLAVLDISYAELNKDDLLHLNNLIQCRKVPHLKELWLISNNLQEMQDELERLVEVCVTHHQWKLELYLSRNHLPQDIVEKLESLCTETNFRLDFKQDIDP